MLFIQLLKKYTPKGEMANMSKNESAFSEIEIDHSDIPQGDLNIDVKTRSNLFNWNGQFSPQFIEALLKKYANKGDVVIDPFLGSGTVLAECARRGLEAYGIELNASAYFMAKTYEYSNLKLEEREKIIDKIDKIISKIYYVEEIVTGLKAGMENCEDTRVSNLISTLIVIMDIYKNEVNFELLNVKWEWLKSIVRTLPYSEKRIHAFQGDSRKIPLEDSLADLLITSPPYINVLNYHQKYRRSVEALGYNVLTLAKSEFGANRKYRCNRFYTVIQYCMDIAMEMKEAVRVCKEGSRMIYVVGRESTVLGYKFCNSELVYNIATDIFGMNVILRQERVFKNRFGTMIYEDILHFENSKALISITEDVIVEKARKIAVRMLESRKNTLEDTKNLIYINEAISNCENIKLSEVAYV